VGQVTARQVDPYSAVEQLLRAGGRR
jgi:hypothetical protein